MNTADMSTTDMNTTRAESLSSTCSHATDSTRRDAHNASSVDFPEPAGALTSTSGTWASMPMRRGALIREPCDGEPVTEPTSYEIVIKGRATAGLLRPLLDDFSFDRTELGVTRLSDEIRDAAHLPGVTAHLTAVGVELSRSHRSPSSTNHHPPHDPNGTKPHDHRLTALQAVRQARRRR